MSKKSKLKPPVAEPPTKSIAARIATEWVRRIEVVAEAMTRETGTTMRKANVFEICVTTEVPRLEKRYGISPDQSAA